ncbi:heat shock 70 kDa protein 12A-like [Mytilus galloprovincialis]|uniref:heat shock 70 kDa protein 12A-like n=1 Tax=Mytilus galloprovincialis TaxID=29158 RepID=UPI003F7B47A9
MQLHNREISLGMMILDVTGKELPAMKVFTESIRFLKDHFLEMLTDKKLSITIDDVFFVITVPAIWSDAAKQFMRVASEKAGIENSQMMLAYEPEAAALFCSVLPEYLGISKYFQERRRLMIVNLGGGTADITVVKVIKREEKLTYIEHVCKVTGGAWGGNQVNKNFEKFLESVFGNDVMDEFKRDYLSKYLEMMIEFEVQKKTLSTSRTKTGVGIRFGADLRHIFKSKRGKDIKDELQDKQGMVRIIGDKLRFDLAIFNSFFRECAIKIVMHLHESSLNTGCTGPSAMILVGGFSDAPLIRKAIVDATPDIKHVVFPVAISLAVLKGSVIFGHEPAIVTGRVCRETLGLTLRRPYVPEGQAEKKTFKIDGQLRADKSFQKMFSINEIIKLGQTRTVAIQDIHTNKELRKHPKIIEVYASQDEDPKYITDAGCSLRGKITVNPPSGKWPENAEGFIDMETGGTEMIARYRDKHSGQITEEAIDFM